MDMDKNNPLGVTVTKHYERDYPPEACHIITMPDQNVAEILREELDRWCCNQPTMIAAPTGSGKTTLAIEIAKYCRRKTPQKWVLLLVNRKAIAIQQMQIFASALGSKWAKVSDPEAFEYFEMLDDIHVIVATYQGFSAHRAKFPLDMVEWAIFDESHVFHADALFNAQLDQLFWKLPAIFSRANRLYLTATPDSVIHDICTAEEKNLARCYTCHSHWCSQKRGKLLLYKFPSHTQHVDLHYFRKRAEIVELVRQNPRDQFLVFTSSKENTLIPEKNSYSKMFSAAGISWGYLDSEHKGTELWKKVCRDGTFDEQVLIATSVLDCGVNLKSSSLRHIIVESTNQAEFLQMIGRRRMEHQEPLNVYIRAYTRTAIEGQHLSIVKKLRFIEYARAEIKAGNSDALAYNGWIDDSKPRNYMHLLNYLGHGAVLPKRTAENFLIWQEVHLNRLLSLFDVYNDDSAVPRAAHKWLEQDDFYSPTRWLDHDFKNRTKTELLGLLANNINRTLNKVEYQALAKDVLELVNRIQVFAHDSSSKTHRKTDTVNNRLACLNVPYEFHKTGHGEKATFTLSHVEE